MFNPRQPDQNISPQTHNLNQGEVLILIQYTYSSSRLFCVFIQEPQAGGGLLYFLTPPLCYDVTSRVGPKVALPYGGMLVIEFVLCLEAELTLMY